MDEKNTSYHGRDGAIDRFVLAVGRFLSWANGLLVLIIVLQVTLRYGFRSGMVALEELEWHLFAVAFMFGQSYDLVSDAHVRVDLFYNRFSAKTKEWVDLLGTLFLLLPFIAFIFWYGLGFFYDSWIHNEHSLAPMGLPCRWVIKGVIPLSFGLFGLAALSRVIQAIQRIRKP